MRIINSLGEGFNRVVKALKGVLITWFCFYFLVLTFVYPLRKSLDFTFGSSMITERLADGFDLEVFADLGKALPPILSFFSSGFMITFLVGFLLNAFLTAGLFGAVKQDAGRFSSPGFFSAGAINFWSFFMISLLITLGVIFLFVLIVLLPLSFTAMAETLPESSLFLVLSASGIVFLLLIPVILLVADNSRSFKTSHTEASVLKSIGKGFFLTFSGFGKSYLMMLILILAQAAPGIAVILFLPGWNPVSDGGVFLLLIVSQLFFFARLFLKTWRYASVTARMDDMLLISAPKMEVQQVITSNI